MVKGKRNTEPEKMKDDEVLQELFPKKIVRQIKRAETDDKKPAKSREGKRSD